MCCGSVHSITIVLYVANTVAVVSGLVLLCASLYLCASIGVYKDVIDSSDPLFSPAILILVVCGVALLLFGAVGLCATCHLDRRVLLAYAIAVIATTLLHNTSGVLGSIYKSRLYERLEDDMYDQVLTEYNGYNSSDGISLAWNTLQARFQCCGTFSYLDWRLNSLYAQNHKIPVTCCKGWPPYWVPSRSNGTADIPSSVDVDACMGEAKVSDLPVAVYFYVQGCGDAMYNMMTKLVIVLLCSTFTFVGLEVVMIWAALNLRTKLQKWEPIQQKHPCS